MRICTACDERFDGPQWQCPACGHSPPCDEGRPVLLFDPDGPSSSDARYRFDELAAAQAWHFWFRNRTRLIVWALRRYFPEARTFLELGCGAGFVSAAIRDAVPGLTITAGDSLREALAFAGRHLPQVALIQLDARQIPFEAEFDVIGAFDVLEHMDQDEAVLQQIFRANRPGGGALITVPQHPWLWSRVDDFSCHKRRYTRREAITKIRRAGFEILRVTSFVSSLLPLLVLSRLSSRRAQSGFDPVSELRVSGSVNMALQFMLDAERLLIQAGASFPAGGSLLVAARRNR